MTNLDNYSVDDLIRMLKKCYEGAQLAKDCADLGIPIDVNERYSYIQLAKEIENKFVSTFYILEALASLYTENKKQTGGYY